jgi:hypothetical protein
MPMRSKRIPVVIELCSGNIWVPTWIKVAMRTIFESVPNPGFSRSGIQINNTKVEIRRVAKPILIPVFRVSPCAKTVQGAFP